MESMNVILILEKILDRVSDDPLVEKTERESKGLNYAACTALSHPNQGIVMVSRDNRNRRFFWEAVTIASRRLKTAAKNGIEKPSSLESGGMFCEEC